MVAKNKAAKTKAESVPGALEDALGAGEAEHALCRRRMLRGERRRGGATALQAKDAVGRAPAEKALGDERESAGRRQRMLWALPQTALGAATEYAGRAPAKSTAGGGRRARRGADGESAKRCQRMRQTSANV